MCKKKELKYKDEINLFDDARWVEKVMLSCKTYKQLRVAYKLKDSLRNKYLCKVDYNVIATIYGKLDRLYVELLDKVDYS